MTVQKSPIKKESAPGKEIRVELSDGRTALIKEGTGEQVENAVAFAGSGQQKKFFTAMMAAVITIEGKPVVPEDLSTLPMRDYLKLKGEFAELNF